MGPDDKLPRALVLGCAGERLTAEEGRFFAAADPLGFVLFRRNCRARDQLRALVDELRASVGRADAPVLVDQEGGRVARLQPPEWRRYPAASQIAALPDPLAAEAARLDARLIADASAIIRGEIGFGGVLVSDDIAMGALDGSPGERTRRALEAGVDLVLHCNGVMAEMAEIVDAAPPISPAAGQRIAHGEARRLLTPEDFDRRVAELRLAELMAGA